MPSIMKGGGHKQTHSPTYERMGPCVDTQPTYETIKVTFLSIWQEMIPCVNAASFLSQLPESGTQVSGLKLFSFVLKGTGCSCTITMQTLIITTIVITITIIIIIFVFVIITVIIILFINGATGGGDGRPGRAPRGQPRHMH